MAAAAEASVPSVEVGLGLDFLGERGGMVK
jgi:hypothetical protein